MTKELVKSENGHKIIKHSRHDETHSRFLGPRIKMGLTAPCLVILFLAAAAAGDTTSSTTSLNPTTAQIITDQTTDNGDLKPSESSVKAVVANNMPTNDGKFGKNDDNDITPDDVTMDELLLFQSLVSDDTDEFGESSEMNPGVIMNKANLKPGDIDSSPNNPISLKVIPEPEVIRRQGNVNPEVKEKEPNADIQFNDSKQEVASDTPPRFGQRSRKPNQNVQDGAPVLQLTQGGYDRPFRQSRSRNRIVSRPDSSQQSEKLVQEPVRNPNRQQETRRIVPQVTYTTPRQTPYNSFGPGAILNPAFETPARNVLAINHNVPTTVQNGFLNTPTAGFPDYTTSRYQAQFPGNDVGVFPNFGIDPNNVALYQTSQGSPFQDARMFFQGGSQGQAQPISVDQARNAPPQFQPNAFSTFTNFDNGNDNSRPDYTSYFRGPTVNSQFQVPPNFYGTNPNGGLNTFNNPPISFLSNSPIPNERFQTQFFRYPVTTDAQNQRNVNDQQPESDASQEDKKTNENPQEVAGRENNNAPPSAPFGTRLSDQSEADVFIRYPTNEAGYAVEENLPPRNSSDEAKTNRQSTVAEVRNLQNVDPYRNALNSLRTNQRRNNTFEIPPQLFRDAPIDFGYQRPQNQILLQQPDRNIGLPRFPSPDFRNPFDPASLPDSHYLFLNANNQRRGNRESDKTPACAKQNNASICFEDSQYPRDEILYSMNSNSYLTDRLLGPQLPLNSISFVEQNTSRSDQTSENYACKVDSTYGTPLRAKNLAGAWRIIVSLPGRFSQPVRLEVCKSLGDACNYADPKIKTSCVQKYSIQRLLTWNPDRGIYSDVYKFPVACSCQILEKVEV